MRQSKGPRQIWAPGGHQLQQKRKGKIVPGLPLVPQGHCQRIRRERINNNNLRSLLQRRYQILQNLDAVLVRPVVEDSAEEIYLCTLNGLRREEVVRHESESVGQIGW
jgi:hypothetical protein